MRISDWSSDVCSSDLVERSGTGRRQWRRSCFWGWWSIAQAAVGADRVVVPTPGFDQHLCFGKGVENLAVEQFVAKRPIEAFVVAVLPGRRWGYVECLHADLFQPFLDCCRDEFAAIIRPDIRSEEHTSELQSLMRISYAVFCLKKKKTT